MKVYQVYRQLVMNQNGRTRIATRDSADAAMRDRDEANHRTADILQAHIVIMGPNGSGQDTGLTLGGFLGAIGVHGFQHEMEEVDVQGSIEVPKTRLILPNN